MAIIGFDYGNCNIKTNTGLIIPTKVAEGDGFLFDSDYCIEINNKKLVIGEGEFDTELDKTKKEHYISVLALSLALSSKDKNNKVVLGLPISQYKNHKEDLLQIIKDNKNLEFKLNGIAIERNIVDVDVFPEGLATYYSLSVEKRNLLKNKEIIILDIGGRTTDIALINAGTKRSVAKYVSLDVGTINIYTDLINAINDKYTLSKKVEDAELIIKYGLEVDGVKQDISFLKEIIKKHFERIVKELNVNYPIRTASILVTGGGGHMFFKNLKKRFITAELVEDYLFSNARGLKNIGGKKWLQD